MGEGAGLSIVEYQKVTGRYPVREWLRSLRDPVGKRNILRRLYDLEERSHFGDRRPLRDGVWELRIRSGPGYRIYYAMAGEKVVLLLAGGDKSSQARDIDRAVDYWHDWCRREPDS